MEELEVEIYEDSGIGFVTFVDGAIGEPSIVEVESRVWVQDAEILRVIVRREDGFECSDGLTGRNRCSGSSSILTFGESRSLLRKRKEANR